MRGWSRRLLPATTPIPTFLVERWLARFGSDTTRRILAADNAPSRLDLLTNPRRTTRDALRSALAAEGVETELSPLAPLALTVLKGNPLRSPLLAAGHFSVQDVGAQLLPLLMPEGDLLVDLAAAPGGKSLSAVAHGRARWTAAVDRSRRRLARVTENVRRLGVPEVRAIAGDFGALPLPDGRCARILLDAPCSGTGTLRKNPEIRYRVTAEAIDRLAGAQTGALSAAARLLAPGGYLLYSTCSLEEEENERVVARVLAGEPDLEPAPIDAVACPRTLRRRREVPALPGRPLRRLHGAPAAAPHGPDDGRTRSVDLTRWMRARRLPCSGPCARSS